VLTDLCSGGHHACSQGKSSSRALKVPRASRCFPPDLEDQVRHARGRTGRSRKPALGIQTRVQQHEGLEENTQARSVHLLVTAFALADIRHRLI
jgi:hypothetical protein